MVIMNEVLLQLLVELNKGEMSNILNEKLKERKRF